jgi:general nucleoside transport system permease protein
VSAQVAERPPAPPAASSAAAWLTAARVGWLGIVLGFLALFVAIPPITIRSPVPTIVLGVAAVVAGGWAIRGGEKRVGWGAVVTAVAGVFFGIAATRSGVTNLESVVAWSALFAAMLRYATPLLFAALGGVMSERSGVINIGLEGMMLMGAFFGVWGAETTGSWVAGLLIGMVSGVLLALIHAVFAVTLRAD